MKKVLMLSLITLIFTTSFVTASKTVYFNSHYQEEDGEPVKFYDVPSGRVMRKNGELYYIITDHLGSTKIVTDSSGEEVGRIDYYPYGSTYSSEDNIPTERKYTGQILDDSTGYYFYNARYYNPEIANFLSPDAAGGGYRYAGNNPVMFNDPSGNMVDYNGGNGGKTNIYLPIIFNTHKFDHIEVPYLPVILRDQEFDHIEVPYLPVILRDQTPQMPFSSPTEMIEYGYMDIEHFYWVDINDPIVKGILDEVKKESGLENKDIESLTPYYYQQYIQTYAELINEKISYNIDDVGCESISCRLEKGIADCSDFSALLSAGIKRDLGAQPVVLRIPSSESENFHNMVAVEVPGIGPYAFEPTAPSYYGNEPLNRYLINYLGESGYISIREQGLDITYAPNKIPDWVYEEYGCRSPCWD